MAWATLDYVVDTLTAVGMSSDESDNDSSGKTEYVIKRMPWRSRYLTELLIRTAIRRMDLAVAAGEMLRGLECGYQVPLQVQEKHHHASLLTFMIRPGMTIFLGEMSGSCKRQTKSSYQQLTKRGTHTKELVM